MKTAIKTTQANRKKSYKLPRFVYKDKKDLIKKLQEAEKEYENGNTGISSKEAFNRIMQKYV